MSEQTILWAVSLIALTVWAVIHQDDDIKDQK